MVLQTLPFPKVAALVFLVLVFFNLATSATGSGLALSLYTAKGLGPRDEPDRRLTIFWCVLFLVMPVGILLLERAIPGLNVLSTIQSMITVSSIPVFFVLMRFRLKLSSPHLIRQSPKRRIQKFSANKRTSARAS